MSHFIFRVSRANCINWICIGNTASDCAFSELHREDLAVPVERSGKIVAKKCLSQNEPLYFQGQQSKLHQLDLYWKYC